MWATSASMKLTRRSNIVLRRSKETSSGSHLPNASRTSSSQRNSRRRVNGKEELACTYLWWQSGYRRQREESAMIKFERVLCPVDLSTESDETLRYAVALGRAYGAKLILLIAESPALLLSGATGSRAARLFEQLLFRHMDADETKTP